MSRQPPRVNVHALPSNQMTPGSPEGWDHILFYASFLSSAEGPLHSGKKAARQFPCISCHRLVLSRSKLSMPGCMCFWLLQILSWKLSFTWSGHGRCEASTMN